MSIDRADDHSLSRHAQRDVEGFECLAELALDLRSSWNHGADDVWRQLDPRLWECTHNPWVVLQAVSRDRWRRMSVDLAFQQVETLVQARRHAATASAWFQAAHPQSPLTCVAYFSMEFMLSEALPHLLGRVGQCGR